MFRTEKRRNPTTGRAYPWLVRATAMVNHFYIYAVDADAEVYKEWLSLGAEDLARLRADGVI